jgi:hypothetical protein
LFGAAVDPDPDPSSKPITTGGAGQRFKLRSIAIPSFSPRSAILFWVIKILAILDLPSFILPFALKNPDHSSPAIARIFNFTKVKITNSGRLLFRL